MTNPQCSHLNPISWTPKQIEAKPEPRQQCDEVIPQTRHPTPQAQNAKLVICMTISVVSGVEPVVFQTPTLTDVFTHMFCDLEVYGRPQILNVWCSDVMNYDSIATLDWHRIGKLWNRDIVTLQGHCISNCEILNLWTYLWIHELMKLWNNDNMKLINYSCTICSPGPALWLATATAGTNRPRKKHGLVSALIKLWKTPESSRFDVECRAQGVRLGFRYDGSNLSGVSGSRLLWFGLWGSVEFWRCGQKLKECSMWPVPFLAMKGHEYRARKSSHEVKFSRSGWGRIFHYEKSNWTCHVISSRFILAKEHFSNFTTMSTTSRCDNERFAGRLRADECGSLALSTGIGFGIKS